MKFVNLTPHAITLITPDGREIVIPPSGVVLRATEVVAAEEMVAIETESGEATIPLRTLSFNNVQGLPPVEEDTLYVVSAIVAQAVKREHPERTDFVVPHELVRDAEGRVIGCRALARPA